MYLLLLSPLAITVLSCGSTLLRQQLADSTDTLITHKLSLLGVIGLELLGVTYLVNALTKL